MRVVAILAAHNEERFIGACLEHLTAEGVESYLIDNDSSDGTLEIAERFLGRGLIGIERVPRDGVYSWAPLLARKEELATEIKADWFMHADPDEIRLAPASDVRLAEAIEDADRQRYNALNFQEFTFVPTIEDPNHDHSRFTETMRWYYPYLPSFPYRLNAWKRQSGRVDLRSSGGHRIVFAGLRMYPQSFRMRHYLFVSVAHALQKYGERQYDRTEIEAGWHRARASFRPETISLQSKSVLRPYFSDDALDASDPWTRHPLFAGEHVGSSGP